MSPSFARPHARKRLIHNKDSTRKAKGREIMWAKAGDAHNACRCARLRCVHTARIKSGYADGFVRAYTMYGVLFPISTFGFVNGTLPFIFIHPTQCAEAFAPYPGIGVTAYIQAVCIDCVIWITTFIIILITNLIILTFMITRTTRFRFG